MPTASMDGCALFVNDIDLPVLPRDHLRPPATTRGAHTRGARVHARRRPVFRSASCCYYLVMVASHMAADAAVVLDFLAVTWSSFCAASGLWVVRVGPGGYSGR